jgi:hypothetical protein
MFYIGINDYIMMPSRVLAESRDQIFPGTRMNRAGPDADKPQKDAHGVVHDRSKATVNE